MKIWRRIIASVLCIALILTAINWDSIVRHFNATEPVEIVAVDNNTETTDISVDNPSAPPLIMHPYALMLL